MPSPLVTSSIPANKARRPVLHGTYGYDKFGYKHAHLPLADALWLWNWTTPDSTDKSYVSVADPKNNTEGTWVWVHD